jgi:diguanylate cyclase (GGDEF)-like protein/PAS domain S-box-containing protein
MGKEDLPAEAEGNEGTDPVGPAGKDRPGAGGVAEGLASGLRLLEFHPGAAVLMDSSCIVRYANPAACSLLGRPSAEVLDRSFWDFLPPRDPEKLLGVLENLSPDRPTSGPVPHGLTSGNGGGPVPVESTVAMLDGDWFGFALYMRPCDRRDPESPEVRRLARAMEQVDETVIITDREGRIEYVNAAFERVTGWSREEVLGQTPKILKSGRHPEEFYRGIWEVILSGNSFHGIVLNRRKDGSLHYQDRTITPLRDESGLITHFVATGQDVTEKALAEQRLRANAERFALSVRGSDHGLWDWDLRTGKIFFSGRWKSMLGFSEAEVWEDPEAWFRLVHPEDLPELKVRIRAHLDGQSPFLESDHRMLHKTGSVCWVVVRGLAVRDPSGKAVRIAGSQTDVTARKITEERLQEEALHDALTGLPNRTLFMDRLKMAMARAQRNEDCWFALMFIDLDRFKRINDGLGHLAGDRLLVEVAQRLRACLRSSDTVARMGGDEFAILMDDVHSPSEAKTFAERTLAQLTAPFSINGREISSTGSLGIALFGSHYKEPSDMVRDADTAMYWAKDHGRARAVVFDRSMHSKAMEVLEMETDLKKAMEMGKMSVHYQPIVSLVLGRVAGFEALARWLHPKRGYVSPVEFIPVAEESGLIHELGRFVLREACRRLKSLQTQYRQRPPLMMSVNLSGIQFMRPDLPTQIETIVREFGLDPKDLKLEITESVIIEHAEHAGLMIDQFKSQNIRLSIDDFGTGYSSMANLRKFPIDTVKVDQSFVRKMTEDDDCLEIIRATITMAHNLGMDVIAEGVEKAEQVRLLKALKCEYGQGYYFSKPVDGESAETLMTKGWLC